MSNESETLLGGNDGGAGANSGGDSNTGTPGDSQGNGEGSNSGADSDYVYPANNFPEGIDKDIASDPSLKVFIKDNELNMSNLMKSYVHSQRLIGKDKIIIPDKHATEDDWNSFYGKIGRPDEASKYSIQAEGDEGEFVESFKEAAHKAGLLDKQASGIYNFFKEKIVGLSESAQQEQTAAYQSELENLKKEWGEGYNQQLALANSALKEFASEAEIKALKEAGLANNITLVRMFNKIGQGLKEDTFKEEAHGSFGMTPDAAQARINDIMGNKEHPYHDRTHPSHDNAVQEVQKLFGKVYK